MSVRGGVGKRGEMEESSPSAGPMLGGPESEHVYGRREEGTDSRDITEMLFLMNKGWQLCNIISHSKSIP